MLELRLALGLPRLNLPPSHSGPVLWSCTVRHGEQVLTLSGVEDHIRGAYECIHYAQAGDALVRFEVDASLAGLACPWPQHGVEGD